MRKILSLLAVVFLIGMGCNSGGTGGGGSGSGDIYSWRHPADIDEYISPDIGNIDSDPQAAMDDAGNALVVWVQSGGVFISERRDGVWTHPAGSDDRISHTGGGDAYLGDVAMDDNGNAIVVWLQDIAASFTVYHWAVFKSEYRNGSWDHPDDIDDYLGTIDYSTYRGGKPKIAMSDNGEAVIVWRQKNSSYDFQLCKSEYRSSSWNHPANEDDHFNPAATVVLSETGTVEMDDDGNTVVAWTQFGSTNHIVYRSEYRSDSWSHPADLDDGTSYEQETVQGSPSVAMDNNGNSLICWKQWPSGGSANQVFMSEYRSGSWDPQSDGTDFISLGASLEVKSEPDAAMDDNGNAIVVWSQESIDNIASSEDLFKSEYRGGSWTHPDDPNDGFNPGMNSPIYGKPDAVMDNNGEAVIVWCQTHPTNREAIYFSEYRDGVWTHPADVDDYISFISTDAAAPSAAMSDNGEALLVWQQDNRVYMSEYR